jgi:hypothetical protein
MGTEKYGLWRGCSRYFCPHFSVRRFIRVIRRIRGLSRLDSTNSVILWFNVNRADARSSQDIPGKVGEADIQECPSSRG